MKPTLVFVLIILVILDIQANTFYVSTSGNDTNVGSEILPWLTIQHAANMAIAGDTVLIKSGIYNERVEFQNSGSNISPIVFRNYQNDTVTVDGTGITWWSWNGLLDISNLSYIVIDGINISKALSYGGIWIENSSHITIKNCYTYNSYSSGISCWGSEFVTIDACEVELACNGGEQECISIESSNNIIVSNCEVHHNGTGENGGEGIDVKNGSHDVQVYRNIVHHINERIGVYADAWDSHTYNIDFYQNLVYNCGNNGMVVQSEMGGLIEYINFYNNIVYNNKWDGIAVGSVTASSSVSSTPVHHIKIINNTLYQNGDYLGGWGFGILVNNPNAIDIIIRNNICSENSAQIGIQQIDNSAVVDHNLLYGSNTASGALTGNDSILENPLFVDVTSFNFYLQNPSPAIDNGSVTDAPNTDFTNTNRPYGTGIDIGAYEYNPTLNTKTISAQNLNTEIYPNPSNGILTIKSKAILKIELIDVLGRTVKSINTNANKITLDLSLQKQGLYVIKVSTRNGVEQRKIILR